MVSLQCPIDMEALTSNDKIVSTPCGHVFHQRCVSEWLQRADRCPQCREHVRPNKLIRLYIDVSDDQLRQLEREKEEMRKELENIRIEGATSRDSDAIYSQLEMTEIALCEERDEHERKIRELESAVKCLEEIEGERSALQSELESAKRNLTALQLEYEEANRRLTSTNHDLVSAEKKASHEKGKMEDAAEMVGKVSQSLAEAQQKVNMYKNKREEAKSTIKKLNKKIEKIRKDSSSSERQFQGATKMIAKLTETLNREQERSAEYKRELETAKVGNRALSLDIQRTKSEMITVKAAREEAERKNHVLTTKLEASQQKTAHYKALSQRREHRVGSSSLAKNVNEYCVDCEELKMRLNEAQQEVNDLTRRIQAKTATTSPDLSPNSEDTQRETEVHRQQFGNENVTTAHAFNSQLPSELDVTQESDTATQFGRGVASEMSIVNESETDRNAALSLGHSGRATSLQFVEQEVRMQSAATPHPIIEESHSRLTVRELRTLFE